MTDKRLLYSLVAIAISFILLSPQTVFATISSTNFPTTVDGGSTWTDPAKIETSNNMCASVTGAGAIVTGRTFSFGIPVGDIIDGIKVEVEFNANNNGVDTLKVELLNGGTASNTRHLQDSVTANNCASAIFQTVGATDLWGTTWTPAQINSASFGVKITSENTGEIRLDSVKVTITHHTPPPPATLTVTKLVVQTGGGTLQVSAFPLFIDGNLVTSGSQNTVAAGSHTVSETTDPNYSSAITGNCATDGTITLNSNDVKSCTITNTFIPTHITVIKKIDNTGGGTATLTDFTLLLDGSPVTNNTQNLVTAGTHQVGEANNNITPHYSPDTGDCIEGQITVAVGDDKTCTITNTFIPTTLTTNLADSNIALNTLAQDFALLNNGVDPTGTIQFSVYSNNECSNLLSAFDPVTVTGNGQYNSPTWLPVNVGIFYWKAVYSGDENNVGATTTCGDEGEILTITKASTLISTELASDQINVGGNVDDSATLSVDGQVNPSPTGTITFNVYTNNECSNIFVSLGSDEVTSFTTYISPNPFFPVIPFTYYFQAVYTGDANFEGSTSSCTGEPLLVTKAGTTTETVLDPNTITVNNGFTIDHATLTGFFPTGTITFSWWFEDPTCTEGGGTVYSIFEGVNGNGVYDSLPIAFLNTGTFYFQASYSGDDNNLGSTSICSSEILIVNEPIIISHSDGGCRGDCTPPTLGVNDQGRRLVTNGFTINGVSVDAEYFYTPMELQTLNVGDPNAVILRIYENEGANAMERAILCINIPLDGYVSDTTPCIMWSNAFDGTQSVSTFGSEDVIFSDVSASGHVEPSDTTPSALMVVTFNFVVTEPQPPAKFGTSISDRSGNTWQNYFNHGIQVIGESTRPPAQIFVPIQKQNSPDYSSGVPQVMFRNSDYFGDIKSGQAQQALETAKSMYGNGIFQSFEYKVKSGMYAWHERMTDKLHEKMIKEEIKAMNLMKNKALNLQ